MSIPVRSTDPICVNLCYVFAGLDLAKLTRLSKTLGPEAFNKYYKKLSGFKLNKLSELSDSALRATGNLLNQGVDTAEINKVIKLFGKPKHSSLFLQRIKNKDQLDTIMSWNEPTLEKLIRLFSTTGDSTVDARRIAGKVVDNYDIENIDKWLFEAGGHVGTKEQLIRYEFNLDDAIELSQKGEKVELEVNYYKGKKIIETELEKIKELPEFESVYHISFDTVTDTQNRELKYISEVTNKENLANQLKAVGKKLKKAQFKSKYAGGPKENVVILRYDLEKLNFPQEIIFNRINSYLTKKEQDYLVNHIDKVIIQFQTKDSLQETIIDLIELEGKVK